MDCSPHTISGQDHQWSDSEEPIKLIYIAGYGRSGTTLLDIALGQHEAIFGAGEITTLARHVWNKNEHCACGAPVRQCPLWKEVVELWTMGEAADFMENYRRFQEETETLVSARRLGWRFRRNGKANDHSRDSLKLLRDLSNVSGRTILVDSSKLPGRAFALARLPGVELYVVHLVRDGRGVAWSLMKPYKREVEKGIQKEVKPKPLFYTAIRWMMVNLAAELLCRQVGRRRSIRIRYEDFVADPRATLESIISLTGEEVRPDQYRRDQPFHPEHQVAGNRHRMQKAITLRKDDRWHEEMPAHKQLAFSIACVLFLKRYGYPLGLNAG